jgi:hypothetical protein
LQDHAQHVGESVDHCQKSLTTMYSVMLPRNPPPENFRPLLDVMRGDPLGVTRSSRIHEICGGERR